MARNETEEERRARVRELIRRQCTSKRSFSTKKLAKEQINRAVRGNILLDYYHCSVCLKYHLTSKRKRISTDDT